MAVKFESRTDCVFATFLGPVTAEVMLQDSCQTIDVAIERGQRLIVIDCSALQGNLTASERFKVGESGAAYAFTKARKLRPKVALVGKPPLIDGFAVIVAANRGINAKVFCEIPQALEWFGLT
jgi:hypothetical protein